MSIESWLIKAVEKIDANIFDGKLNLSRNKFQIYFGKVGPRRMSESVRPTEETSWFPITIGISYKIQDQFELLTNLTYECIKAFISQKGVALKRTCKKYGFDDHKHAVPSRFLGDLIKGVMQELIDEIGEFPGIAIQKPEKEKKEKKSNQVVFFCPECGLEYKVKKSVLKDNQGTPTCICGTKCGREFDEEKETPEDES